MIFLDFTLFAPTFLSAPLSLFLFLLHFLHHLLSCTLWADYIFSVLYESFANHGLVTDVAEEALVMPRQRLESHELGTA